MPSDDNGCESFRFIPTHERVAVQPLPQLLLVSVCWALYLNIELAQMKAPLPALYKRRLGAEALIFAMRGCDLAVVHSLVLKGLNGQNKRQGFVDPQYMSTCNPPFQKGFWVICISEGYLWSQPLPSLLPWVVFFFLKRKNFRNVCSVENGGRRGQVGTAAGYTDISYVCPISFMLMLYLLSLFHTDEVLLCIFSTLSLHDVLALCLVCRRWVTFTPLALVLTHLVLLGRLL